MTITLRFQKEPDGSLTMLPTRELIAMERWNLERDLESLPAAPDPTDEFLGGLAQEVRDRLKSAPAGEKARLGEALGALSAAQSDQQRARLEAQIAALAAFEAEVEELFDPEDEDVVEKAYEFEPYTVDQRIAARAEAETPLDTGGVAFSQEVFRREIVRRCVKNLQEAHGTRDPGAVRPATVVDRLYNAIARRSEPTLNDILFTRWWRRTQQKAKT